ncbi:MAG: hypothetical protein BGO49_19670 [Planctomycetales bacterium 71-10]|nr:MAG: hypothetical protein BGO49_19670 [Planctomycetales bacterium 71-10]
MSTPARRQAAVSDAMEDVRTRHWPAYVEWEDFEEGEMSYRVERDGRDLVVGVVVVLVREDEVVRREESHRFPGDMDPGRIAANVMRRLEEVHDAVHGSKIPEEGVGRLMRPHRLRTPAERAYLHRDATALGDFFAVADAGGGA